MKKIGWIFSDKEVIFNLNWLEYFILVRIFKKRKYKILNKEGIRGEKLNMVIVDEVGNLKW